MRILSCDMGVGWETTLSVGVATVIVTNNLFLLI